MIGTACAYSFVFMIAAGSLLTWQLEVGAAPLLLASPLHHVDTREAKAASTNTRTCDVHLLALMHCLISPALLRAIHVVRTWNLPSMAPPPFLCVWSEPASPQCNGLFLPSSLAAPWPWWQLARTTAVGTYSSAHWTQNSRVTQPPGCVPACIPGFVPLADDVACALPISDYCFRFGSSNPPHTTSGSLNVDFSAAFLNRFKVAATNVTTIEVYAVSGGRARVAAAACVLWDGDL